MLLNWVAKGVASALHGAPRGLTAVSPTRLRSSSAPCSYRRTNTSNVPIKWKDQKMCFNNFGPCSRKDENEKSSFKTMRNSIKLYQFRDSFRPKLDKMVRTTEVPSVRTTVSLQQTTRFSKSPRPPKTRPENTNHVGMKSTPQDYLLSKETHSPKNTDISVETVAAEEGMLHRPNKDQKNRSQFPMPSDEHESSKNIDSHNTSEFVNNRPETHCSVSDDLSKTKELTRAVSPKAKNKGQKREIAARDYWPAYDANESNVPTDPSRKDEEVAPRTEHKRYNARPFLDVDYNGGKALESEEGKHNDDREFSGLHRPFTAPPVRKGGTELKMQPRAIDNKRHTVTVGPSKPSTTFMVDKIKDGIGLREQRTKSNESAYVPMKSRSFTSRETLYNSRESKKHKGIKSDLKQQRQERKINSGPPYIQPAISKSKKNLVSYEKKCQAYTRKSPLQETYSSWSVSRNDEQKSVNREQRPRKRPTTQYVFEVKFSRNTVRSNPAIKRANSFYESEEHHPSGLSEGLIPFISTGKRAVPIFKRLEKDAFQKDSRESSRYSSSKASPRKKTPSKPVYRYSVDALHSKQNARKFASDSQGHKSEDGENAGGRGEAIVASGARGADGGSRASGGSAIGAAGSAGGSSGSDGGDDSNVGKGSSNFATVNDGVGGSGGRGSGKEVKDVTLHSDYCTDCETSSKYIATRRKCEEQSL